MTGALGTVGGAADVAATKLNDNLGTKVDSILRKLSPENLVSALEGEGFEGVKKQIETAVGEASALWDTYGDDVMKTLDLAWTEMITWFDETGLPALERWWDETGREKMGEIIGNALRGAFQFAMSEVGTEFAEMFANPTNMSGKAFELFTGIDLPFFHAGGIVPGGPSTETLAVLRGGERVFTPTQDGYAPQAAGGGFTIGALNVYGAEPETTARRTAGELRRLSYLRSAG
jgi:hypothetical protein